MLNMNSTVIDQARHRAGAPASQGGRFRAVDRPEGPSLTLAENWPAVPNAEQRARALERARLEADNRAGAGEPAGDEWIEERAAAIASHFAEHEAAFEYWKDGLPHYDDERYLAIWNGDASGLGRDYVTRELAYTRQLQSDFEAGLVRPSKIIGSGIKKHLVRPLAEKYLRERIAELELAMECQGRNLDVNQSNVLSVRRRLEREALPF